MRILVETILMILSTLAVLALVALGSGVFVVIFLIVFFCATLVYFNPWGWI